jgi:hypothetical protein
MRKFATLVILTLSLAHFAYADDGHIDCPVVIPPAPQPTVNGHMDCPGLSEMAESLILSLLSLS